MRSLEYKWWVLIIVMIGTLMAALDSSIVNVSIPSIMADYGVGVDDIEWVITSYMLAFSTLMPITVWVREQIGHKILFLSALFVFTLGSVLCGVAWNLPSMIVARVIQAFGGGALTPTGMAMIAEVFSPQERGKAMGLWGIGVIVGPAFGPTLGGFLTKFFGWRSIFLVNLPVGIICFVMAWSLLKEDRPQYESKKPFDIWGFAFLSIFLVAFLLGLSKGQEEGWFSPYIVSCAILSLIGLVGFLVVESQVSNRVIDIGLFVHKDFTIAMIVTCVRSIALYGGTFLLPLFLQQLMGKDEIESGLTLLPGSLIIGFFMPIAGRMSDKMGPRILTTVGLFLVGLFLLMYHNLDVYWSDWDVILPTIVRGVGIGLLSAPVTATALNAVPKNKAGMASSMMNLIQQVGGSIGIALLATILSNRTHFHIDHLAAHFSGDEPRYLEVIKNLFHTGKGLGLSNSNAQAWAHSMVGNEMMRTAMSRAYQDAFIVGGLLVMIAIIPALMLPNRGHKSDEEHEMMVME